MKKLYSMFFVLMAAIAFSCEDDSTEHVSFITTYPVIDLKGPHVVTQPLGTEFVDQAEAKVGDETVELKSTGSVDANTPGVYTINYSATNKDGFARTDARQVVVYDPATDAVDLTGSYLRAATGVTATVVKVSPSTYHIDDAAGFGSNFLDVLFVNTTGNELVIPTQVAPSSGITVTTVPDSGVITATGFEWVLNCSAVYGTSTRVFEKL